MKNPKIKKKTPTFNIGYKEDPESYKVILKMSRVSSKITCHMKSQENLNNSQEERRETYQH